MPGTKKTALVISGGGSKGAFAVGVVKYLFNRYRETGWFNIIGGTSAGALIAPLAALLGAPRPMSLEVLDTLIDIYRTVKTSDILKERIVLDLIVGGLDCLNRSNPLNDLLQSRFRSEWFEWLKGSNAPECYVTYVNYQNGQKVTVSPKDRNIDHKKFMKAMLASASVPVIMEATIIDDEVCYDGGVRDLLPFGKAIKLGAETIVPIFLDPEEFSETQSQFERIDTTLLRTLAILVDETGRNDVKIAEQINVAIQVKEEILEKFKNNLDVHQQLEQVFNKPEYQGLFDKHLVKIVYGLRPDQSLTESPLIFDPSEMRRWMNLGEQKAGQIFRESPFI